MVVIAVQMTRVALTVNNHQFIAVAVLHPMMILLGRRLVVVQERIRAAVPSGSTNDGSESLSLLPELESAIKNKVDSIIKNTISSIKDNTPFLLPFP